MFIKDHEYDSVDFLLGKGKVMDLLVKNLK